MRWGGANSLGAFTASCAGKRRDGCSLKYLKSISCWLTFFIVSYLGYVNMSPELLNLIQTISLEAIKISGPVVIVTFCAVRK
jgi:hypothetical protein